MGMKSSWFVLSILLSRVLSKDANNTLLLVQMVFRHGDRTPMELYPHDPNPVDSWPEGQGQLTKLGKKQLYALGKYLRSMYRDFITSSPNEVRANSTAASRCIESAQAILSSLYAPTAEWKFDENLSWQPIPISYLPMKKDKYLVAGSDCSRAVLERRRLNASIENEKLFEEHRIMLENLTFYSGAFLYGWKDATVLYDSLFIEKRHNLTIPTWVDPYWNELEDLIDSIHAFMFNTPLLQRLRAGPFLQKVIENMNKKLSGEIPYLKVQIFSSHDLNIIIVLQALGLYNLKKPPYCATLIFELYEGQSGQKLIRLLYLNSTRPENEIQKPHVLTMEGCSEFCPLEFFTRFTQHLIPDDWEKECQTDASMFNTTGEQSRYVGATFCICFGIGVVMTLATCSIKKYVRKICNACRNCFCASLKPISLN